MDDFLTKSSVQNLLTLKTVIVGLRYNFYNKFHESLSKNVMTELWTLEMTFE